MWTESVGLGEEILLLMGVLMGTKMAVRYLVVVVWELVLKALVSLRQVVRL